MRTLIAILVEHHAGVVGPDLAPEETAIDFQGFKGSGLHP